MTMDFQSAMETFAEAWVAANTKGVPLADVPTQSQALALTRTCKTPSPSRATSAAVAAVGRLESPERTSTPPPPPPQSHSLPLQHQREPTPPSGSAASPPSIKEEFDPSKTVTGKSLPVHCVVEAICTLDENRTLQHNVWRRRPLVEMDSFVIIPIGTPFHTLVHAALLRLGYSAENAAAAKGSVIIKNWKALNFDQISDDPLVTVGDILGELTTIATLRIQVFRGQQGTFGDIKDKLLRFLLLQSHGLLISSGCPLDEIVLSQFCRTSSGCGPVPEISEDVRRKFEQWWSTQFSPRSPASRSQFTTTLSGQYTLPVSQPHHHHHHHQQQQQQQQQQHHHHHHQQQQQSPISKGGTGAERGVIDAVSHPALQTVHNQFPTQKTRMRTSFDPELELPKLQRWFTENQHPSRQQIQQYVKELNSLESRRGRKPLDVNNVVYWFKNARAAQKRAEVRSVGPGLPCHLAAINGYSSGHSPTNGAGFLLSDGYMGAEARLKGGAGRRAPPQPSHTSDEFSNAATDLEDDEMGEQPPSPVAPLSLTTGGRKSRNTSPRPLQSPHQAQLLCKDEVADDEEEDDEEGGKQKQPINYHASGSDLINNNNNNNNNNNTKAPLSDLEEDDVGPKQDGGKGVFVEGASRLLAQRYCASPDMEPPLVARPADGLERLAGFPLVTNSMFGHGIMYMSHYIPGLTHAAASPPGSSALGMATLTADERRKRNRTFIDPVTEVPRLEQWFSLNTHPSHNLILKYTEELNCMPYRQKFPRLEPKNVQFWFKNRRAKCKRLKMSLFDAPPSTAQYHHNERD